MKQKLHQVLIPEIQFRDERNSELIRIISRKAELMNYINHRVGFRVEVRLKARHS